MSDILTLAQARAALHWQNGSHANDEAELQALYIPAVTEVIEDECGRMADRRETWYTDNASPITTPWAVGAVKVVALGRLHLTGWEFDAPTLTIDDTAYTAGDRLRIVATDLPTPAKVTLVAGRVLARLWNADKQGSSEGRPAGTPAAVAELTAEDLLLLAPYRRMDGPA